MERKLLWLALLVSLGVLMTPLVSTANYFMNCDISATAPVPIDIQPAALTAATPTSEPGGLDFRLVNIVLETAETAYKDPPSPPATCTAKTCRVGAVTQGGSCSARVDGADLKKRTFANFRGRGQRMKYNRR
jgi:hypothetical protein